MSRVKRFVITGLAMVTIDQREYEPLLRIVLDPAYRGDLNDIEEHNHLPSGVYLECDSTSCINMPELAKFMQVLAHWDFHNDGTFDGDDVANAIEDAMWMSREAPDVFHRPNYGVYTRLLMRFMPPAPERHIVFGFGDLRVRFRWHHYVWSAITIAVIIGLINLQIALLPFMKYSVVSGVMAIGENMHVSGWVAWFAVIFVWYFLRRLRRNDVETPSNLSPHTYGFFNKAAVSEEQAFREGSENWSTGQRAMSCLVFGAIHMANLIYPLATIIPLALGGAVFMVVYLRVYRETKFRRSAVLASAIVHRVYNRLAIIAFVASLALIFGSMLLVHIGIGVGTLAVMVFGTRFADYITSRQQIVEPVMD